jgi:hypothetical protein
MNGKQMACIVLLMIIGAVTYGAQIVHKKAAVAIQAADDEAASAELAANDANVAKITLEKAKSDAQDLERFLVAWTPVIQRLSSRQEVESAVQANTREARVFVVSQKFEEKANVGERMRPRSILATLSVEDEYSKVLNWLGSLEKKIPLVRISSCRISAANTGRQVHMEVTLEVAVFDLSVNPLGVEVKKKK